MSWPPRLIILLGLFLFVLVIISLDAGGRQGLSWPEQALLEVVATGQRGVTTSARAVEDFWRNYFFLVNLREENEELRRAVAGLRAQVNELREAGLAHQRLERLLSFKNARDLPAVGARVVGWDPGAWFKTVLLDKGSADGLKAGMPVVSGQGVVGRIIGLSPHYAKVLLIIDFNSSVGALVQRNRVRGVLVGRSAPTCGLKYVRTQHELVRGDMVVTSGLGGVFPKGLPLGRVSRVKKVEHDIFLHVEVAPAVDFSRLEEVLVVLKEDRFY